MLKNNLKNNPIDNPPEADASADAPPGQDSLGESAPEDVDQQPIGPEGEDDAAFWQEKYESLQDQFTRLAADFENYRKRVRDEQQMMMKYGAEKSVLELLPVLDNLERAQGTLKVDSDSKTLFQGIQVLQKQLIDSVANLGVQKIKAVGQVFNPEFHDAVNQMESVEFPENTIIYEAQSGYLLHDKVIRPAQVVVSTGAGEPQSEAVPPVEETHETPDNPFMR